MLRHDYETFMRLYLPLFPQKTCVRLWQEEFGVVNAFDFQSRLPEGFRINLGVRNNDEYFEHDGNKCFLTLYAQMRADVDKNEYDKRYFTVFTRQPKNDDESSQVIFFVATNAEMWDIYKQQNQDVAEETLRKENEFYRTQTEEWEKRNAKVQELYRTWFDKDKAAVKKHERIIRALQSKASLQIDTIDKNCKDEEPEPMELGSRFAVIGVEEAFYEKLDRAREKLQRSKDRGANKKLVQKLNARVRRYKRELDKAVRSEKKAAKDNKARLQNTQRAAIREAHVATTKRREQDRETKKQDKCERARESLADIIADIEIENINFVQDRDMAIFYRDLERTKIDRDFENAMRNKRNDLGLDKVETLDTLEDFYTSLFVQRRGTSDEMYYSGEHMLRTQPPYAPVFENNRDIMAPYAICHGELPTGGKLAVDKEFGNPARSEIGAFKHLLFDRDPMAPLRKRWQLQKLGFGERDRTLFSNMKLTLQLRNGLYPWVYASDQTPGTLYTLDHIPDAAQYTYNVTTEQLNTRFQIFVGVGDTKVPLWDVLSVFVVGNIGNLHEQQWATTIDTVHYRTKGEVKWQTNPNVRFCCPGDEHVRGVEWVNDYDEPYKSDSRYILIEVGGVGFANLPRLPLPQTHLVHLSASYRAYPRIGQLMRTHGSNVFSFLVNLGEKAPYSTAMIITKNDDAVFVFKANDEKLYIASELTLVALRGLDYAEQTRNVLDALYLSEDDRTRTRERGDFNMSMWTVGGNKPDIRFEPYTETSAARWWFSSPDHVPTHETYVEGELRPCIGSFVDPPEAVPSPSRYYNRALQKQMDKVLGPDEYTTVTAKPTPPRRCWYCGVLEQAAPIGAQMQLRCVKSLGGT
jgi:hypothetical protein